MISSCMFLIHKSSALPVKTIWTNLGKVLAALLGRGVHDETYFMQLPLVYRTDQSSQSQPGANRPSAKACLSLRISCLGTRSNSPTTSKECSRSYTLCYLNSDSPRNPADIAVNQVHGEAALMMSFQKLRNTFNYIDALYMRSVSR